MQTGNTDCLCQHKHRISIVRGLWELISSVADAGCITDDGWLDGRTDGEGNETDGQGNMRGWWHMQERREKETNWKLNNWQQSTPNYLIPSNHPSISYAAFSIQVHAGASLSWQLGERRGTPRKGWLDSAPQSQAPELRLSDVYEIWQADVSCPDQ